MSERDVSLTRSERLRHDARLALEKIVSNPAYVRESVALRRLLVSSATLNTENRRLRALLHRLTQKYDIPLKDLA